MVDENVSEVLGNLVHGLKQILVTLCCDFGKYPSLKYLIFEWSVQVNQKMQIIQENEIEVSSTIIKFYNH